MREDWKRWCAVAVAALASVVVAACASPCQRDADCGAGQACQAQRCVVPDAGGEGGGTGGGGGQGGGVGGGGGGGGGSEEPWDAGRPDGGEPGESSLSVVLDGADVALAFTSPAPTVRVLRKLGGVPLNPTDGDVVFAGSGTSARHPLSALLPTARTTVRRYTYALFGCNAGGGACVFSGFSANLEVPLMRALQAGGYTVYFRHAETFDDVRRQDVCQDAFVNAQNYASNTPNANWWRSCTPDVQVTPDWVCTGATARQLSATGVTQATTAGANLRARAVPFSRVLSSEYCRCFRSAELMNLGPTPELLQELTYHVYGNVRHRCNDTRALLATVPAAGTNVALVGHSALAGDTGGLATIDNALCTALEATSRGNAIVFKPLGDGGVLQVLAGVTPADWAVFP